MGALLKWFGGLSSGLQWAMAGIVSAVVVALGLSLWWNLHQAKENGRLGQGLQIARDAADANAKQIKDGEARHRDELSMVAKALADERTRNQSLNRFIDEVLHAPESDNGPLAPVLSGLPLRLLGNGDSAQGRGREGSAP